MSRNMPIINPDFDLVNNIYPFTMKDLDGQPVRLDKYKGYVCIIVNISWKSDFSVHNYRLLNILHDKYFEKGLRILGFPCEQFNKKEFRNAKEIKKCIADQNIKFEVFGKININCNDAHPLWRFLKASVENFDDKWGLKFIKDPFTKFIINRAGTPCARMKPAAHLNDIVEVITPLISPPPPKPFKPTVELPPPTEDPKKDLPCMEPWHFESGIQTLT